jgi:hypothetical protein
MKVFRMLGSAKYRYVPCAVRSLGGGSGIFIVLFAWVIGVALINHHFVLTHWQ